MKTIHSSTVEVNDSLRNLPSKQIISRASELIRSHFTQSFRLPSIVYDCNRIFGPRTLWLFTASDFYSVVLPWTVVGLFSALSGPLLTTNASPSILSVLQRAPSVFTWMWLNALVFSISNQRLPASVLEDQSNKPWRPLPSSRITPDEARKLLLVLIPAVFALTSWLGAGDKTLYAMVLTYMYNDLQGSDESFVTRNLLNALGLTCWSIGASQVAIGSEHSLSTAGYRWFFLLGALIFTTIQMPDFRDLEGDQLKDRKTLPIALGEVNARLATSLLVMCWSISSPLLWGVEIWSFAAPITIGCVIAWLLSMIKTKKTDGIVWKLWGLWVLCIAMLPLCRQMQL